MILRVKRVSYTQRVSDKCDFEWTREGKASAEMNGVELAEVIQALHHPYALSKEFPTGGLYVVAPAASGRMILVICDRVSRTRIYQIAKARLAMPIEIEQWKEQWL